MSDHIVMFTWLAFGHMIPFLQLSQCLAQKGHIISFISTPRNIHRLPKIPSDLSHLISFVELPLPSNIQKLPNDAEATIDLPHYKVEYLKAAFDGLETPLTTFLEKASPDWIIYDFAPHWLPSILAKLCIPSAFFSIFPACVLTFLGPPSVVLNGSDNRRNPGDFTVPPKWVPFPSSLVFRKYEILKIFNERMEENVTGVSDMFRVASAIQGCDVLAVRSCMEVEPEWLRLLADLTGKPIIPVGLLPPSPPERTQKDEKWVVISEWLDKQETKTVVYVAFGSEAVLSHEETTQLALGLEQSMLPFFWVLRKPVSGNDSDSNVLPDGFEERTQGHGFIWRDWAPQLSILGHPSIGVFLSHCGWSSVIESLGLGCPLVLFPLVNDQGINARMLQGKEMGLEIPRDEQDGSFSEESVAETLRKVVVDKEGEPYRTNATTWRKVFGDKALHNRYFDNFAGYLKSHARSRPPRLTQVVPASNRRGAN